MRAVPHQYQDEEQWGYGCIANAGRTALRERCRRRYRGDRQLFSSDVETVDPASGALRGIEPFLAYEAGFHQAFRDGCMSVRQMYECGDSVVVVEGTFSGTQSGPLVGPSGSVPPSGRTLDLPYCDVFEVENGRVARHHIYYDQVTFLDQLGLMPAPSAA